MIPVSSDFLGTLQHKNLPILGSRCVGGEKSLGRLASSGLMGVEDNICPVSELRVDGGRG